MTLYYNINDKPDSPSSTLNTTSLWRPYNSTPTVAPSWLPLDQFNLFNRSDGASQVEFLGWPLYYYVGDANPGDMKGEGLLGEWYVFDPYNPPG
jgi:predicted lipoprotein with Yx(FWY)xxD motif